MSARISGFDFLQVWNVASATCIAFSANSRLAFETRPTSSSLFAGFTETILSSVVIFSPQ